MSNHQLKRRKNIDKIIAYRVKIILKCYNK